MSVLKAQLLSSTLLAAWRRRRARAASSIVIGMHQRRNVVEAMFIVVIVIVVIMVLVVNRDMAIYGARRATLFDLLLLLELVGTRRRPSRRKQRDRGGPYFLSERFLIPKGCGMAQSLRQIDGQREKLDAPFPDRRPERVQEVVEHPEEARERHEQMQEP